MFESILLPVDGSKYSDKAAEKAFSMVKKLDRDVDITVLNVVEVGRVTPQVISSLKSEEFSGVTSKMKKESKDTLKKYEEMAEDMGVKIKTESTVSTDAANAIVSEAEEIGCSHIIIGSKGRTGLSRAVLGSVAEKVVKNGHCPVTVIR